MRKVCQNSSMTFLSVIGMTILSLLAHTRIYNNVKRRMMNVLRLLMQTRYLLDAFSTIHLYMPSISGCFHIIASGWN